MSNGTLEKVEKWSQILATILLAFSIFFMVLDGCHDRALQKDIHTNQMLRIFLGKDIRDAELKLAQCTIYFSKSGKLSNKQADSFLREISTPEGKFFEALPSMVLYFDYLEFTCASYNSDTIDRERTRSILGRHLQNVYGNYEAFFELSKSRFGYHPYKEFEKTVETLKEIEKALRKKQIDSIRYHPPDVLFFP